MKKSFLKKENQEGFEGVFKKKTRENMLWITSRNILKNQYDRSCFQPIHGNNNLSKGENKNKFCPKDVLGSVKLIERVILEDRELDYYFREIKKQVILLIGEKRVWKTQELLSFVFSLKDNYESFHIPINTQESTNKSLLVKIKKKQSHKLLLEIQNCFKIVSNIKYLDSLKTEYQDVCDKTHALMKSRGLSDVGLESLSYLESFYTYLRYKIEILSSLTGCIDSSGKIISDYIKKNDSDFSELEASICWISSSIQSFYHDVKKKYMSLGLGDFDNDNGLVSFEQTAKHLVLLLLRKRQILKKIEDYKDNLHRLKSLMKMWNKETNTQKKPNLENTTILLSECKALLSYKSLRINRLEDLFVFMEKSQDYVTYQSFLQSRKQALDKWSDIFSSYEVSPIDISSEKAHTLFAYVRMLVSLFSKRG